MGIDRSTLYAKLRAYGILSWSRAAGIFRADARQKSIFGKHDFRAAGDPSTDNSAATRPRSVRPGHRWGIGAGSLPDPMPTPRQERSGRAQASDNTIIEKISEGGMGLVYKATDMLDRAVALKVMFCGEHETSDRHGLHP